MNKETWRDIIVIIGKIIIIPFLLIWGIELLINIDIPVTWGTWFGAWLITGALNYDHRKVD
jgi:hypothetical protein